MNFNNLEDAIFIHLSNVGIEINDPANKHDLGTIPKTIYNISTKKTIDVPGTHIKTKNK